MGGALLKGWIANGLGPLYVVEPKPTAALRTLVRRRRIRLFADASRLPSERFAACVVALKPQVLKEAAPSLRRLAEMGTTMISIAAGTTTASLSQAWGAKARIVRSMPNTPGAIGHGITALFATPEASSKDRKLAERLLSAIGETVWLAKEDLIDAATAVSGSGPAYVFLLTEALADAGIREGLPHDVAQRLARSTVSGAGALLRADKASPAELRRNVTSPGGTTEAALKVLTAANGLPKLIRQAVNAARRRARELGR